jgi:hypothetical protein
VEPKAGCGPTYPTSRPPPSAALSECHCIYNRLRYRVLSRCGSGLKTYKVCYIAATSYKRNTTGTCESANDNGAYTQLRENRLSLPILMHVSLAMFPIARSLDSPVPEYPAVHEYAVSAILQCKTTLR